MSQNPSRGLREHVELLDEHGLLRRVTEPIDKDTEMIPLVRCQFRGLPAEKRKGWLFESPTDQRGNTYDIPLGVSLLGANREVYRLSLECETDAEIVDTWNEALESPLEPRRVSDSPVTDNVYKPDELDDPDEEMDILPVPISTPGFDPAPFHTSGYVVTKDPDTGVYNMGTYRCHLKSPTRFGVNPAPGKGGYTHWQKAKERGEPLEAAIVLGGKPELGLVSVSRIAANQSEFEVAGGLDGEPLDLVECETIDLEVPASADIVIEGTLTPETYPEGPFGEYTGYMGEHAMNPNFHISALSHRDDAIYQAFISEMPPSESSLIKKVGWEETLRRHLRNTTIDDIQDVVLHEMSAARHFLVIQLDKSTNADPWQAMYAAMGYFSEPGKFTIAVDPDIDPHDIQSVMWAMSFRVQPREDVKQIDYRTSLLDPVSAPFDTPRSDRRFPGRQGDSALLIDATMPWDYPPTSLPTKPFMEDAIDLWDELGYEDLEMVEPWHGESLGEWAEFKDRAAQRAVDGEYFDYDFDEEMLEYYE